MPRTAVFAYASLVDPKSAAETLGRPIEPAGVVRLAGWRRRWSQARENRLVEKTFARSDDGTLPRWILGLNLEPSEDPDEAPNGVLIEVSDSELDRLDIREVRYWRTDVTDAVEPAERQGFERIVTYTARDAHFAPEPPSGAVILAPYARTIEAAFAALGEVERERYLQTTGPPPVELIEAVLVHDRIPPGNPRTW